MAEAIAERDLPGVHVITAIGEPAVILDAWTGTALAVVVDAAVGEGCMPGRVRRWIPGDVGGPAVISSHALGLQQTFALGQALRRIPDKLVVLTVEVADVDNGVGLTPAVAAAVPEVVAAILTDLGR